MPTIPKSDDPVQLQPLRGARQSLAGGPGAFGDSVGRGISQMSESVDKIAFEELARQNEAKTKELDVEFSKSLRAMQYDPQQGYYAKRGKDAYDYQPLFEKATEKLRDDFIARAENESQRDMLSKVLSQRVQRAQDGVSRHALKEYNAWIDGTALSRAEDAMQEAIVSYNDPKYVNQLKVSGRNEIINVGQRAGKDQEAINNDLKEYDSKIHVGTVEHIMQLDVGEAREYFEANKDEIDGREQSKLLRKLKVAEKGDLATSRADYAALSHMAAFEPEKFINEELSKYELSDTDFKRFENAQVTAKRSKTKHDDKMSGIKRAMSLSDNALRAAGVIPKKRTKKSDERINQFQGQLLLDIEEFRRENGRGPNDDEILKMTDSLLIRGKVPGTGIAGFFQDEAYMFENEEAVVDIDEVPEDMQVKIRDSFKRKYGRAPTEKEIEYSYTNFITNRKVGD
jgi:hypothetical protein